MSNLKLPFSKLNVRKSKESKEMLPQSDNLGVCVKNQNQVVLSQNQVCIDQCGYLEGQRCEKGCMAAYDPIHEGPHMSEGIHPLNNLKMETDKNLVDAVVINDGNFLTTLFYIKSINNQKRLEFFRSRGLSKSEIRVISLILEGHSNAEIAKKLFISKATLKTHINHIYKKLPQSFRPEKLRK